MLIISHSIPLYPQTSRRMLRSTRSMESTWCCSLVISLGYDLHELMSCLPLLVIFSHARQLNYFSPIKKKKHQMLRRIPMILVNTPQPCEPGNSSFWPSTSTSFPASWNTSSTPGRPRRWWRNAFATDPGALRRGGAAEPRLKPWNMETLPDFGFDKPEKNGGKVWKSGIHQMNMVKSKKYCD